MSNPPPLQNENGHEAAESIVLKLAINSQLPNSISLHEGQGVWFQIFQKAKGIYTAFELSPTGCKRILNSLC